MVKYVTLSIMIAITKYFEWTLDQLDVVTAFLYGEVKEKVFCAERKHKLQDHNPRRRRR